jgi:hypothetical protein
MEDATDEIPPSTPSEDPQASYAHREQEARPAEAREAVPSEADEQMKEFDLLRKRENEIGEELDRQLLDVLD